MEFKGVCKNIDRIIVSDPSYGDDVWCRYEHNSIGGENWCAHGFVSQYNETVDGLPITGVEFVVALHAPTVVGRVDLHEDGSFSHWGGNVVEKYTIGMDTACVGLGVNEQADDIKACRGGWQPDCCLRTLTDGEFGSVFTGRRNDKVNFIVITGFLDEDTGYSIQDIVDYLVSSLDIELEKSLEVDNLISDASKRADKIPDNVPGVEKDEKDLS